jgi:galactokinase
VVTSAPGRINLIGEPTDDYGGPVLSIAIERRTAVAAGLAPRWSCISVPEAGSDVLTAVVRQLSARNAAPPGAGVAVAGSLPAQLDFGGSIPLGVAMAKALSLLAGRRLANGELLEVALRAERESNGAETGRTDPTVVTHGQRGVALLVEPATGSIRSLPFPGRVWIMATGVSRDARDNPPGQWRRESEEALASCRQWRPGLTHLAQLSLLDLEELRWRLPASLLQRVRQVVADTARARAAAVALADGDLAQLGGLMLQANESLRPQAGSSSAEADLLVSSAVAHGAYGARLTGAGRQGAVIMLAPPQSEARIVAQLSQAFEDRFGRVLEVWSTRAAGGVRRETIPGGTGDRAP